MSHTALGTARAAVIQQHTGFLPRPSHVFIQIQKHRCTVIPGVNAVEHPCFYWWMLITMPGKPCPRVPKTSGRNSATALLALPSLTGARREPHTCPSHWPTACPSEWNIFQRNRKQMFDVSVADVQGTHWPYAGVKASPSPLRRKCIGVWFPCGFIWVCKSSMYSAPISTL